MRIGEHLEITKEDGQSIRVTVINVSESEVTLDCNHHLAREDGTFDIQFIDIL